MTIELLDFQREAAEFVLSREGALVAGEQGTGKTYVTAGVIDALRRDYDFCALLVVPLANVETTWVRVLTELGVEIHRTWKSFLKTKSGVLLLHYEMFRGSLVRRIVKRHWSLVVFDESQRLKERGSKASRAAKRFKSVDHRLCLSGTPIEQAPQDLWAQFRFFAPDVFGVVWEDFAGEWLKTTGFMGYKYKFRDRLLPQFLELIRPYVFRVRKDEVLTLPPITFVESPVEMLGEQRRVYDEMSRDSMVTVDGFEIIADLEVTRLVRLQQIAGGFIRLKDPSNEENTLSLSVGGNAKLRRLRAIARREDRPIVVFTKYREERESAVAGLQELGMRVGVIAGGREFKKNRRRTIERFQRGEYDALVCQIRAGGVGIDLFRSHVGVVHSATFSSIDFDQAIARLHRIGQTHPVRIYLTPCLGTVDTTIQLLIATKRKVAETVLDGPHRKRRIPMGKKDKKDKTEAKTEEKKEEKKAAPEKPKYGVPELAEALGIKQTSVRVQLRNAGIEKKGKTYGWDSKAEMQEVIDKLKASKKERKAKDADDSDDEDGDDD